MKDLDGLLEVFATKPLATFAFARLQTAMQAKNFIIRHEKVDTIKKANLWAIKNRSPEERQKKRYLSVTKLVSIEVGGAHSEDVMVDWAKGTRSFWF